MLLTPEQFFGFLFAALLITVSPGPDNLMVLSMGISRGRKRGMIFGLGCALGCLSHTLLAALGISALIAASPIAFASLKITGGLYLIYLGIQALRSQASQPLNHQPVSDASSPPNQEPLLRLFAKGLFANSINPKVVLFFLSFLPQFIVQKNGHLGWQTMQLGFIFTAQAVALFSLLGYFSGAVGQWLNQHPKAGYWLDKIAGSIFIAIGLRLLLTH